MRILGRRISVFGQDCISALVDGCLLLLPKQICGNVPQFLLHRCLSAANRYTFSLEISFYRCQGILHKIVLILVSKQLGLMTLSENKWLSKRRAIDSLLKTDKHSCDIFMFLIMVQTMHSLLNYAFLIFLLDMARQSYRVLIQF